MDRIFRRLLRSGFLFTLLGFSWGCGSCPAVEEERTAQETQRQGPKRKGPHIRLELRMSDLTDLLGRQAKRLPKGQVALENFGRFQKFVGKTDVRVRDLRLSISKRGSARLGLKLGIFIANTHVFDIHTKLKAPVKFDAKTGAVLIVVNGKSFERAAIEPADDSITSLTNYVYDLLPRSIRLVITRSDVDRLASTSISSLTELLARQLRRRYLESLGEIARLKFTWPDLPIERVDLRQKAGILSIGLRTSLRAHGLGNSRLKRLEKGEARFTMSMDTVSALGNWAMSMGRIPNRYSIEGKPDPEGLFDASLGWRRGEQPLKVNLWSRSDNQTWQCLYVRASAEPSIQLRRKSLKVKFKNGQIEEVIGPPLFRQVDQILGISERTFAFTRKVALKQKIKVGGKQIGFAVEGGEIQGESLSLTLRNR